MSATGDRLADGGAVFDGSDLAHAGAHGDVHVIMSVPPHRVSVRGDAVPRSDVGVIDHQFGHSEVGRPAEACANSDDCRRRGAVKGHAGLLIPKVDRVSAPPTELSAVHPLGIAGAIAARIVKEGAASAWGRWRSHWPQRWEAVKSRAGLRIPMSGRVAAPPIILAAVQE